MTTKKYEPKACKERAGFYEIKGYPGYAASRKGEILNKKTGHITKGGDAGRYLRVSVYKDGSDAATLEYVHDLVCTAFHGPRPSGLRVLHANNQRFDNRASNLGWGTQSDNITQTYSDGVRKPANQYTVSKESLGLVTESWAGLAKSFAEVVLEHPLVHNGPTVAGKRVDTRKQERENSLLELLLDIDSSGVTLTEDQTTLFMEWLDQGNEDQEKFKSWQQQTLIGTKPTYIRIALAGYYGGLCSLTGFHNPNQFVQKVVEQVNHIANLVKRYEESLQVELEVRNELYHTFSSAVEHNDSTAQIQVAVLDSFKKDNPLKELETTVYRKRLEAATKAYPFFGQVNRVVSNGQVLVQQQIPKTRTEIAVKGSDLIALNRAWEQINSVQATVESYLNRADYLIDPRSYPYQDAGKHPAFTEVFKRLNETGINFYTVNQFYAERVQVLRSIVNILRGLLYFSDTVLKR